MIALASEGGFAIGVVVGALMVAVTWWIDGR